MAAKGRESGCWLVILEIRRGSTKLSLCLAEGTSQFREFCPPKSTNMITRMIISS